MKGVARRCAHVPTRAVGACVNGPRGARARACEEVSFGSTKKEMVPPTPLKIIRVAIATWCEYVTGNRVNCPCRSWLVLACGGETIQGKRVQCVASKVEGVWWFEWGKGGVVLALE